MHLHDPFNDPSIDNVADKGQTQHQRQEVHGIQPESLRASSPAAHSRNAKKHKHTSECACPSMDLYVVCSDPLSLIYPCPSIESSPSVGLESDSYSNSDRCQIVYLWLLLLLSVKGKKCISSILETIRTLLMLNSFPFALCFVLFWWLFFVSLFLQCVLSSGSVQCFFFRILWHQFFSSLLLLLLCFSFPLKAVKEILSRRFAVDMPKGFSLQLLPFLIFFSISASPRRAAQRLSHITTLGTLPRSPFAFIRTWLPGWESGIFAVIPLLHLTLIFVRSLRDNGGERPRSLS